MKRFVKMFQPRFAGLVEEGSKRQTIRPVPKRMPAPGDLIDCRAWTGAPYRSKQRKLCEGVITAVWTCILNKDAVLLRAIERSGATRQMSLRGLNADEFAKADGFRDFEEMALWFEETHQLPFTGILIKWEVKS